MVQLRAYAPGDCPVLAALFAETVRTVNAADYTPEQIEAWVGEPVDVNAWDRSLRAHTAIVAEEAGRIVGFGDMDASGYLDQLYVHRDFQRQGIASALCAALEAAVGGPRFVTHASLTARPFFESRGYRVIRAQQVVRRGVALTNFVMEKQIEPAG